MTETDPLALSGDGLLDRVRAGYDLRTMQELFRRLQDPAQAPDLLRGALRILDAGMLAARLGELRDAAMAGDARAVALIARSVHPVRGGEVRRLLQAVVPREQLAAITRPA